MNQIASLLLKFDRVEEHIRNHILSIPPIELGKIVAKQQRRIHQIHKLFQCQAAHYPVMVNHWKVQALTIQQMASVVYEEDEAETEILRLCLKG